MEEKIINIEKEIEIIKERNRRVEADKAWETSGFRIFSVCLITYIIASFVLYFIGVKNFLLNALVPTVGFFLSIQSLPAIKKWWIRKYLSNK
ncbi:MAG: hypothetical protein PHT51_02655 [Patescibacteria group bacterium]|nr:hypothetical protein [Methanothrix sp.]MDD4332990.1 hypothetical protein [Patescibacteria group bacterium]MDD4663263.1 hypothetical protein [Caldisericia bacterium]